MLRLILELYDTNATYMRQILHTFGFAFYTVVSARHLEPKVCRGVMF